MNIHRLSLLNFPYTNFVWIYIITLIPTLNSNTYLFFYLVFQAKLSNRPAFKLNNKYIQSGSCCKDMNW